MAVLSETDVTGRRVPHRRARPRARAADGFFDDLEVGSFVVHRQHGVARFEGVTSRTMGGHHPRLPDPAVPGQRPPLPAGGPDRGHHRRTAGARRRRSRRWAGRTGRRPGPRHAPRPARWPTSWSQLYRRRLAVEGHAFGPDTPWQTEMEGAFGFVETEDQLKAIADVKADMEEPRPMDRLICGDVGFGKTEVAVRAVFKAVQDGTQAAVLAPTTLAGQPARPDLRRPLRALPGPGRAPEPLPLAGPAAQGRRRAGRRQRRRGRSGPTGCWRRTSQFKELGLLVVDEEQRFGVTHKEAVKRLAEGVDVLTLTASPIPRTLEMALTGIRDLSMVNTPPADRRPILTYVGEHDPSAVSEALRRELLREGQAFYVHNRVSDIERVARRDPRRSCPRPGWPIAHGQMDEGSLETVVLDFWERRYDVLVCTTIIESGIDMPSVNTLIVDRADLLGLGQLHQIRGRVGRSGQRAYAYLFHPADRVLSETGLRAAADDRRAHRAGLGLQDRHARPRDPRGGQPLGLRPVGAHRGRRLRPLRPAGGRGGGRGPGEARPTPPTVSIDVPGDAHLPKDYVAAEDARLEAYRRLAAATTTADVDDIGAEWADRYGPLPRRRRRAAGPGPAAGGRHGAGHQRDGHEPRCGPAGRAGRWCASSPVALPASAQVRLRRLAPGATYREDLGQLLVPVPAGELGGRRRARAARRSRSRGRFERRRGHPVRCAAREATPRSPHRLLWAGGVAAAAFAIPSNAASVNGATICQAELNSDVHAIAGSADYQCYLNSETYLSSNGQPEAAQRRRAPARASTPVTTRRRRPGSPRDYLDTEIGTALLLQTASEHHVTVTQTQSAAARTRAEPADLQRDVRRSSRPSRARTCPTAAASRHPHRPAARCWPPCRRRS